MLEQADLNKLKINDKIEHFLLLSNYALKTTKNGNEYLDLTLRDRSTSMNAKMWSNFATIKEKLKSGMVVKVLGIMDEFNNQPQIKIERIREVNENDNVIPDEFLPQSERPIPEMQNEIKSRIDKIDDKYLKKLLNTILDEVNLEKFSRMPAGKALHHAYIGGLLEHTLEIIRICDLMCSLHKEINRDLVITGAILHDFGKLEELDIEAGFNYTDKGKLLGHIVIVAKLIDKESEKINNFPDSLKMQLLHLVLSHQGKLEFASPVIPKTIEAIVLYHADELSAKTNAYKNAVLSELELGENWTKYLPLAETSLFIPNELKNNKEFKDTLF